jgi:hypothetical protein
MQAVLTVAGQHGIEQLGPYQPRRLSTSRTTTRPVYIPGADTNDGELTMPLVLLAIATLLAINVLVGPLDSASFNGASAHSG